MATEPEFERTKRALDHALMRLRVIAGGNLMYPADYAEGVIREIETIMAEDVKGDESHG